MGGTQGVRGNQVLPGPNPNNAMLLAKDDIRGKLGDHPEDPSKDGRKRTLVMTQAADPFQKAPLGGTNPATKDPANPHRVPHRATDSGARGGPTRPGYSQVEGQARQGEQARGGANGRPGIGGGNREQWGQDGNNGSGGRGGFGDREGRNAGGGSYGNGNNQRDGNGSYGNHSNNLNHAFGNNSNNPKNGFGNSGADGKTHMNGNWNGFGGQENNHDDWTGDNNNRGPGGMVFPKVSGKLQPHEKDMFPGPDAKDKFGKEDKHLFGISMGVQKNLSKPAKVEDEIPNFINPIAGNQNLI